MINQASSSRKQNYAYSCASCRDEWHACRPLGAYSLAEVCHCQQSCSVCNDTGFRRSTGDALAVVECGCRIIHERVAKYNQAGIPAKFWDARLSKTDSDNKTLVSMLQMQVDDYKPGNKGMLLMGQPGVGKTFILCAFAHELIFTKGVEVVFRDFFQLLSDLKKGYAQNQPESALIEPLVSTEVLIIDELGKGRHTEWEHYILDALISQRYNQSKTTMFTTNYTCSRESTLSESHFGKETVVDTEMRQTLSERLGRRIFSRLQEMCYLEEVKGRDRRQVAY